MSGSGNDFIFIDNRDGLFPSADPARAARLLCRRGVSVGADGLVLIESADDPALDFRWRFYNADGSEADMCGNAARCAARLAHILGISGTTTAFFTGAGVIRAEVLESGRVKLAMTDPKETALDRTLVVSGKRLSYHYSDTGVPHAVLVTDDVVGMDVAQMGRAVRYHENFAPNGANANFVRVESDGTVTIRTYERGVEAETLACGTGAVAAAVTLFLAGDVSPPVTLIPTSTIPLVVHFIKGENGVTEVYLEGDARLIYTATLHNDALT
ncbi:MAG: diaminopimelate epimerase [Deltaproteobacteria bacterium]|nr:diaminopimelate epimerase [Candidatus Zymogenaceae bacterium]